MDNSNLRDLTEDLEMWQKAKQKGIELMDIGMIQTADQAIIELQNRVKHMINYHKEQMEKKSNA